MNENPLRNGVLSHKLWKITIKSKAGMANYAEKDTIITLKTVYARRDGPKTKNRN